MASHLRRYAGGRIALSWMKFSFSMPFRLSPRARSWLGRLAVVVLLVGVVGGLLGFGFAAFVRARLQTRAAVYGAEIYVERVHPGFGVVTLQDMTLRFADAPAVALHFETVRVAWSWTAAVKAIEIGPGTLTLSASAAALSEQFHAVRQRKMPSEKGSATPVLIRDLAIEWKIPDSEGPAVHVVGASAARTAEGWRLWAHSVNVTAMHRSWQMTAPVLDLTRSEEGIRWAQILAGRLTVEMLSDDLPKAPDPATPPESFSARVLAYAAQVPAWRLFLAANVDTLDRWLTPTFRGEMRETHVTVPAGDGDPLELTLGRLSLTRDPTAFRWEIEPTAEDPATHPPVRFHGDIPVARGEPVEFRFSGGPLPLRSLGLRDGNFGLAHVDQTSIETNATIRVAPDASVIFYDTSGRVHDLALHHPALAAETIAGFHFGFQARGEVRPNGLQITLEQGHFETGNLLVNFSFRFAREEGATRLDADVSVPASSCQGLLDAFPTGFAPDVSGMTMNGLFSFRSGVHFDSSRPSDAAANLAFVNDCRVTHVPPALDVARFRGPFRRRVYDPAGQPVEITAGPGTSGWTPYAAVSPYVTTALMVTEDGGFFSHHGFDREAIRNSIRDNVKAGKFLRGASTISMQTAKNMFLERKKTLSRKFQEAVLAIYLEQSLSKFELLELYLNSVEFGPMIYGVGPAAEHYFHTAPTNLSLAQSLFLCSLLPSPNARHFDGDGRLSAGWSGYLRKLMGILLKRHLIDETEYRTGLTEQVVFGQPEPLRTGEVVPVPSP